MKSLVKIQLIALAILTLGASVANAAASAVVSPSTVPKGAYVVAGSGPVDQQFLQSIYMTGWLGAFGNTETIVITLPADIRVADVDGDGSLADGVWWTGDKAAAVAFAPAVTATAGVVTITFTATSFGGAAGDDFTVIFPITSSTVPGDDTQDYSIAFTNSGGAGPDVTVTPTITYADSLTLTTFSTDFLGGDVTSDRGDVYPAAVSNFLTAVVPDLIVDNGGGTVSGNNTASGSQDDWGSFFGPDGASGGADDLIDNNVNITGEVN
ncbi:MAG: hypothetical protein IIC41_05455, partial [Candidatus Marinimicrobia bacterium]|nr:hypothetical protein [Candidatus Neomarinimicrobiota bacterium]